LLRAIARLATERGLVFALGVWSQHAYRYGAAQVTGLDARNLASFAAHGMRRLLEAVSDISGVQLRVNAESGIHLDEGTAFWRTILGGIRACGRPIRLDLRAKGIVDETVAAGLATGLPVTVSTKFWMEHQGLPYHAVQLQDGDRFVRCGSRSPAGKRPVRVRWRRPRPVRERRATTGACRTGGLRAASAGRCG
jgi:hypothetical protein